MSGQSFPFRRWAGSLIGEAGLALSLPSILVIYGVIGWRKTLAFCALTVGMSTIMGYIFGVFAG